MIEYDDLFVLFCRVDEVGVDLLDVFFFILFVCCFFVSWDWDKCFGVDIFFFLLFVKLKFDDFLNRLFFLDGKM